MIKKLVGWKVGEGKTPRVFLIRTISELLLLVVVDHYIVKHISNIKQKDTNYGVFFSIMATN